MKIGYFLFTCLVLVLVGCQEEYQLSGLDPEGEALFTKLENSETGIDFSNMLDENVAFNGIQYEYFYNGSGLAVVDFNNDGLKDIFFVSALKQHKLFLNKGNLQFIDASNLTGILLHQKFSGGITVVDINNDGWMDIYISNSGKYKDPEKRKNKLYVNMGAENESRIPTFSEQSAKYGLDLADCSTQATFFDYDKDGDLDMFLLNHNPSSYPSDKSLAELITMDGGISNDKLLRNDNSRFTDVSKEAGIVQNRLGYGLGIAVGDVNNDGWPDMYVANDFTGKDFFYINNKNGSFTDRILEATKHISFFAMGNDMADINNDGWLDMMTVDMMGESNYDIKTSMSGMNPERFHETVDLGLHHQYMYNTLQLNSGYLNDNNVPIFSDIAQLSGVSKTDWSWAPLFFDMDNDGLKDLFVSNGIKRDFRNNDFVNYVNKKQDSIRQNKKFDAQKYIGDLLSKMPTRKKENFFFRNQGNLNFSKMNEVWGDGEETSSNGAVYADLDNDGDLEIIVNNTDDPAFILKNNARELGLGHYLSLKFNGPKNNRDGIGARVIVTTDESRQVQELYFTRGFMSAMSRELHFGIGKALTATVEVIWPDDKHQILNDVSVDQLLTLEYAKAENNKSRESEPSKTRLFKKSRVTGIDYIHKENDFDDFKRESLLPHKMSHEGPAMAVGDVNGDGLDDMYLGGALERSGKLYVQNSSGGFTSSNDDLMRKTATYEDVAAEFFDADGDGDLDLYVVSGGNEYNQGSSNLRDRLYVNDGKGGLSYTSNALPNIAISGSCVKAADFDKDGDIDLFVGGRQVPGKYPAPAQSYLLRNNSNNGKIGFDVVTGGVFDDWKSLGMVTDALWVDLNKDDYLDLVVTGEWMPIRVFESEGGRDFVEKTEDYGLKNTNGWWYSLAAEDFDQDGDIDIIAGNLGLNYKYRATAEAPFEVYADDFDDTGSNDIVLGYYDEAKLVPVRGRQCSSQQMPFIKEKFPTYDAFGKAEIGDIFDERQLKKSVHQSAYTFATTFFESSNGVFKAHELDNRAQFSSVNDILVDDFNGDGYKDLLLAGNLYASEVETPRNDASYGLFMKGDGRGGFHSMTAGESGVLVQGDVKYISPINIKGVKSVVFAKNNDAIEVLSLSSRL
ncbi:VCBS repeat-containing protein [uncultured Kriegella sp.]|uniref:VCBS repeat-containing protein n=1 Tax=uncultured Kriegella sp. TaxID=1798910 RepID=UPI0030D7C91B